MEACCLSFNEVYYPDGEYERENRTSSKILCKIFTEHRNQHICKFILRRPRVSRKESCNSLFISNPAI